MTHKYSHDEVPMDAKDFHLQSTQRGNMIHYKGIPLLGSIDKSLHGYSFAYYDPELNDNLEDDPRYYTLIVTDALGDRYHFGRWYSKTKFMEWLRCPYDIYNARRMGGAIK